MSLPYIFKNQYVVYREIDPKRALTGIIRKSILPSLHLPILLLIVSQNLKAPEDQPSEAFLAMAKCPSFRLTNPLPDTVLFSILQLEHIIPGISLSDLNNKLLPGPHNNTIPSSYLRNKEKITQNDSILSP